MATKAELDAYVGQTFSATWATQDGQVVPSTSDVPLNNTAKYFKLATFLYADLDGSTAMVDTLNWQRSAEIYKTYLYCASRMIRHFGGDVVAFDGDRVMGVFLGDLQSTNATKSAMAINWALKFVVAPLQAKQYGELTIGHSVGVDVSEARCCRTGVRGDSDLVWVGSAANIAAKLTNIPVTGPLWITDSLYNRMADETKFKAGQHIWTKRSWTQMNNRTIYNSDWHWAL